MVVGVLGAIAQDDMKRILSFHIVSQIGYMILGVGLFTVSGLAGAVFFVLHQIPVKASLFLVGGLVEHDAGSTKLSHVGGLVRRIPLAATLFLLAALSLAGIPPLSGFVGQAGAGQRRVRGPRVRHHRRQPAGQRGHPLLDGQDLERRVLGRRRGADAGHRRRRRPSTPRR